MFIPSLRQSKLLWNLLTSSGKSCFNHACYEYVSRRPPPLRTATFIPSICRIYIYKFRIVIGLHLDMQTRPLVYALYPVSVRQTGTLPPASFGFPSRWTPLPLANDSYYQGSFGTYVRWLTDPFRGRLSRLLVAKFVLFSTQLLAAHIFIIITIHGR